AKERDALNNWPTNKVSHRRQAARAPTEYYSTVTELSGFQPTEDIPKKIQIEGNLRRHLFVPEPIVPVEQLQPARIRRDEWGAGFGVHDLTVEQAQKDENGAM